MNKTTLLSIVGGIIAIGILWFAYYAISPLFNTIKANDSLPVGPAIPETTQTQPTAASDGAEGAVVTGTLGHPASGTVRIITVQGKNYVRYENFKTINGPDIYVYLAKDKEAKEFISLGKVTATEGNINYDIPAGVDPKDYSYVLTWCKTFGVLFNSAQLK